MSKYRNGRSMNKLYKELGAYPDAKKHKIISFIKSGIRILGYCVIPFSLLYATILLVLSEVVGIIEELV